MRKYFRCRIKQGSIKTMLTTAIDSARGWFILSLNWTICFLSVIFQFLYLVHMKLLNIYIGPSILLSQLQSDKLKFYCLFWNIFSLLLCFVNLGSLNSTEDFWKNSKIQSSNTRSFDVLFSYPKWKYRSYIAFLQFLRRKTLFFSSK